MLNIEKYEEELRPFGTCFAITKDGKIKNCKGFRCAACAFYYGPDSNCDEAKFEWLIKEYKEPILTDKEKTYLKNVIEPRKDKDNDIWVNKVRYSEFDVVTVYEEHPISKCPKAWSILNFIVTEELPFKGLDLKKEYNIKELGL